MEIFSCSSMKNPLQHKFHTYIYWIELLLIPIILSACTKSEKSIFESPNLILEENGGLFLPDGFIATPVVNQLEGKARHLAINVNGDIYVKLRHPHDLGGNAVLRDLNGDNIADSILYFGVYPFHGGYGTAMRIYNGYLYYSSQTTVYRQKLIPGQMLPESTIETVVDEDNERKSREHIAKPLAFDDKGNIYVPFGAPSNACQDPKRTPGAPGLDPCPQLEKFGGIWKFDANRLNQLQEDGEKFATGIRSVVALDWDKSNHTLYTVMHGRDDLLRLFPEHFSPWESAMLPSEEFLKVTEGSDFGWPYCYYDQLINKKVLAPEYGGDGTIVGRCDSFGNPIMGFPGHWAPNDLLFYKGTQFPERYTKGAFVAFHGSTNRAPYPQAGYFVGFIPFENGMPTGAVEIFVDGFARVDTIQNVRDAVFRPMGLAEGPDGSLYISETEKGAIWKIEFKGQKENFSSKHLLKMQMRKNLPHFKTPDITLDNLQLNESPEAQIYNIYCATCHQPDGNGDGARFPPLAMSEWVTGDKETLIGIVLNGIEGEMQVRDRTYNNVMPRHDFLSDAQIAEVLTYIRRKFNNNASEITQEEVNQVRNSPSL